MPAQRHLVDVDLLLEDQVQQQIEGPLEDGRAHLDSHGGTKAIGPSPPDPESPRVSREGPDSLAGHDPSALLHPADRPGPPG